MAGTAATYEVGLGAVVVISGRGGGDWEDVRGRLSESNLGHPWASSGTCGEEGAQESISEIPGGALFIHVRPLQNLNGKD